MNDHFAGDSKPVATEYSADCNCYRVRFDDGSTREIPGTSGTMKFTQDQHEEFCTRMHPRISFKFIPKGFDPVAN